MLRIIDTLTLNLLKPLRASDNSIWLSSTDAKKLNAIGSGNSMYFSVHDNRASETIMYEHYSDFTNSPLQVEVPIVRDTENTGRYNFGAGTCITAAITDTNLSQFICENPCLVATSSAVASLSTVTNAYYTELLSTRSSVASLSTSVNISNSSISTAHSAIASLSTSVNNSNNGISTAHSAIASLSTATSKHATTSQYGTVMLATKEEAIAGIDETQAITPFTLNAVLNARQPIALDDNGTPAFNLSTQDSAVLYSYTIPVDGIVSLSGFVDGIMETDPLPGFYYQINLSLMSAMRGRLSIVSADMTSEYGIHDGLRACVSKAAAGLQAGDVITMVIAFYSTDTASLFSVPTCNFSLAYITH